MELGLSWVVLTALLQGVQAQAQLEESGGGSVAAGGSLQLSCKASKVTADFDVMGWFRQSPTHAPVPVAAIYTGAGTPTRWFRYFGSAEGRFTASQDNANNIVHLEMNNLKPEDTGTYYCATWVYKDYGLEVPAWSPRGIWGQGTQVTVSSGESSTASLLNFGESFQGTQVTVSSGESSTVSLLNVGEPFQGTQVTVSAEDAIRPQVHLLPPPSEELALNEMVTLTCVVRGFSPKDVLVRWLHGNQELPREKYLTWRPLPEPEQSITTYAVTSLLRVEAEAWKQGDNYSCMVGHEALPLAFTQKTIDRLSGKPTHVNVSVVMAEAEGVCY